VVVVVSSGAEVVVATDVVVLPMVVDVQAPTASANATNKKRRRVMSSDYRTVKALN